MSAPERRRRAVGPDVEAAIAAAAIAGPAPVDALRLRRALVARFGSAPSLSTIHPRLACRRAGALPVARHRAPAAFAGVGAAGFIRGAA